MKDTDLDRLTYLLGKVYRNCYVIQAQSQMLLDDLIELGYNDNDDVFIKNTSQKSLDDLDSLVTRFDKTLELIKEKLEVSTENTTKAARLITIIKEE